MATLPPKKRLMKSPEFNRISSESDSESPPKEKIRRKSSGSVEGGGRRNVQEEREESEDGGGNLSSDIQMDPKLLNASAMAWAALSNQVGNTVKSLNLATG